MHQQSSLSQGLQLLAAATQREATGRSAFTVSRLADHTGLERSRVSRLTQELVQLGMLEKNRDLAFRPGRRHFEVAAARQMPWLREARRELRGLVSAFQVDARISASLGDRALLLRFESPASGASTSVRPGMVTPIWCTGAGRALLWDASTDELQTLLGSAQFVGVGGPRAPYSVTELSERQTRDRATGHIDAFEEFEHGTSDLAAPIRGEEGAIVGALSCVSRALPEATQPRLVAAMAAAADRLSALAAS
ncbi:IclR family transcriptional regulator [Pseudoclavibacter sp. RFBG4]|uniref:IclR family transcriptional regulator n=1 Tax=Pseudoclavibacter sp. RFBG4 TaxID=2080575 RepID=UPI000CE9197F|nr:IclR family transcriptional regulator C-terminal domain-containing protein [Pseudoclavibacter sp. RFBG4]PPG27347.1 IclR family transcriptional regulator [Pseudoclavibacter sp. RFBG4]